ncbi:MAG: hypothetical protein H7X71_06770 [Chitinophagales bacterium]|nr:hypothetical protein [Chitinophagales bacterium]
MFIRHTLTTIFLCIIMHQLSAQTSGFGKEYNSNRRPFRIFYFGYDLVNPGVQLGPEYDFIWKTTDKISCETGTRYVDKFLLFCPQVGFFTDPAVNFSLFMNVELDYRVIYDRGWIFEMFIAPGYAVRFGDGMTPMTDIELNDFLSETKGAFMPQIGLGTGYSFKKVKKADLMINLRILSSSDDIQES